MVANVATARKIAVLFYNILKKGTEYVEMGLEKYEENYKIKKIKMLQKMARQLGMEIVPQWCETVLFQLHADGSLTAEPVSASFQQNKDKQTPHHYNCSIQ